MLRADNIVVRFGGLTAIDQVSLALEPGAILGLIGPNGAGKSTLVNALTGFQRHSGGNVRLGDVDITGWTADRIARHGVARTFQAVRLFLGLTVLENLAAAAIGAGHGRRDAESRAREVLDWMALSGYADVPAGALPYGDQRRVAIGRALALSPRFLLLDEPAAGMTDAECDELVGMIGRVSQQLGCGVLLIEHNMRVIMNACARIHVIDSGQTIAEGTPAETRNNRDVVRAYLGSKSERQHARG